MSSQTGTPTDSDNVVPPGHQYLTDSSDTLGGGASPSSTSSSWSSTTRSFVLPHIVTFLRDHLYITLTLLSYSADATGIAYGDLYERVARHVAEQDLYLLQLFVEDTTTFIVQLIDMFEWIRRLVRGGSSHTPRREECPVRVSDQDGEEQADVSSLIREIRHLYNMTVALHSVVPGEGGVGLVFRPANTNNPAIYMASVPDGPSEPRRRRSGAPSQGSGHQQRSGNSASNTTLSSSQQVPSNMAPPTTQYAGAAPTQPASYAGVAGIMAPSQYAGAAPSPPTGISYAAAPAAPSPLVGLSYAGGPQFGAAPLAGMSHGGGGQYAGAAPSSLAGMSHGGGGQYAGAAPSSLAGMSHGGGGQYAGAVPSPLVGMPYAGGAQFGAAPLAGMSHAGGAQYAGTAPGMSYTGAAPSQPSGMSFAGGSQRGGNVPPALTQFAAAAASPPPAFTQFAAAAARYHGHGASASSQPGGVTSPSGGQFAHPTSSMQRQPSLSGTVASSNTSFTATSVSSTEANTKYAVIAPGSDQPQYLRSLSELSKASARKHRRKTSAASQSSMQSASQSSHAPSTSQSASKPRRSSHRMYHSTEDFSSHSRGNAPYPSFRAFDLLPSGSNSGNVVQSQSGNDPRGDPLTPEDDHLLQLLKETAIACRQARTVVPLEFILKYVPIDYEFPLQTLIHMGYIPAVLGNETPDFPFTPVTRGHLVVVKNDIVAVLNATHRMPGDNEAMFNDLVRALFRSDAPAAAPAAAYAPPAAAPAAAYAPPAWTKHPVGYDQAGPSSGFAYRGPGVQQGGDGAGGAGPAPSSGHPVGYDQAGPSSGFAYRDPGVQQGGDGAGGAGPAPSSGWAYGGGNADGQYRYENYAGPS